MIKRILLPLDESVYTAKALDLASWLARHHDAELTGLAILDRPGLAPVIGTVPLGATHQARQLSERRLGEARERQGRLRTRFEAVCAGLGIRHTCYDAEGAPGEVILDASKYFDVLILGQRTFLGQADPTDEGVPFDRLLGAAITPVIAVPEAFDLARHIRGTRRFLIAFDAGLAACRAVQRFAQMAVGGDIELQLVMSHPDADFRRHSLTRAEELLRAHGFARVASHGEATPITRLLPAEELNRYDGIVIGAPSRHGLWALFTGSFTRHIIDHARRIVFIGQ